MPNPDKTSQAPVNTADAAQGTEDFMEAQLQQELRSMFEVDTQKGLQTYLDQAARLQPQTWNRDIQTLYRTIHTIKGGAVTVGAEAILQVSTRLEDLLSDLRHLDTAPPLQDGRLGNRLIEAGELLAATIPLTAQGEAAIAEVFPTLEHLQTLRQQIQQDYLPQWSEERQIQQEFARQGLDLVVLDLEIAIENLPQQGALPEAVMHTARNTLDQLYQIGRDLQLSSGWGRLLRQAETLMHERHLEIWRSQWPRLFQALQDCAQQAGQPVPFDLCLTVDSLPPEEIAATSTPLTPEAPGMGIGPGDQATDSFFAPAPDAPDANAPDPDAPAPDGPGPEASFLALESAPDLLDLATDEDVLTGVNDWLESMDDEELAIGATDQAIADPAEPPVAASDAAPPSEELTATTPTGDWLTPAADWMIEPPQATSDPPAEITAATAESIADPSPPAAAEPKSDADAIQIPVPLTRLDQSAQDLIGTLLSVRHSQAIYQTLQAQILQLVSLAQEGNQYITQLRQIQEDYALIDNLKIEVQDGSRPTLESYRQGYTTINRLLETSLRLSEIGAEAEKSAKQMTDSLQFLDSSVLKLQTTVEESRLVPFSNLGFRARAILRDLTTRFQKPARLIMSGEQTELDVGTARSLEPALLHLIRNAFDHALEPTAERQRLGKPEQGTLTLSLQRLGSTYRLEMTDDGRGIDPAMIQARAEALGLPLTSTETPADLLAVICQPGFSSETEVSTLSGRGVGMDVVAAQIANLGGKLTLDTKLGEGTTFHLQFPVPHLLVPCVLLQASDRIFAIPTDDIKTTALFESLDVEPVADSDTLYSWQIHSEGGPVPGLDLMEYWQPLGIRRSLEDIAICTCIQSHLSDRSVWLMADELLGQSDLIITPLPEPMQPPEGMIGVSLQPDGSLVPVLNTADLVERLHLAPAAIAEAGFATPLNEEETYIATATILIVDDAALMRRRLEASLNASGHDTHTCADGLEAWNWLQANPRPTLILTDIEMPNMDGFTLIDRCRQTGMTMPILVVSSRLSEDWFEEARRVGATDYLTKGFSTPELLAKVEELFRQ